MNYPTYIQYTDFKPGLLQFSVGSDRTGKPTILLHYATAELAMLTPAAVTNWPRVNGDGNFGTMWGPSEKEKAKFTLDITDAPINDAENTGFVGYSAVLEQIDDALLDFVHANQTKLLGRKSLSKEELKMLQIRSVRAKVDKNSGATTGYAVQMSTPKYVWDGFTGRVPRDIDICDKDGNCVPNGQVSAGDVVSATSHVSQCYIIGDKFGVHWSFGAVQVICQRTHLAPKTSVPCFATVQYEFAQPYNVVDEAQFVA